MSPTLGSVSVDCSFVNTVNASNLLFLLALGLLFGGVRDGDIERSPQRCQVAAAERRLAEMAGLVHRSADDAEISLRKETSAVPSTESAALRSSEGRI